MLFLFKYRSDKTIDKRNNKVIGVENGSNNTIFLAKSKNLIKFKNLSKYKSNKAIKKSNF